MNDAIDIARIRRVAKNIHDTPGAGLDPKKADVLARLQAVETTLANPDCARFDVFLSVTRFVAGAFAFLLELESQSPSPYQDHVVLGELIPILQEAIDAS